MIQNKQDLCKPFNWLKTSDGPPVMLFIWKYAYECNESLAYHMHPWSQHWCLHSCIWSTSLDTLLVGRICTCILQLLLRLFCACAHACRCIWHAFHSCDCSITCMLLTSHLVLFWNMFGQHSLISYDIPGCFCLEL